MTTDNTQSVNNALKALQQFARWSRHKWWCPGGVDCRCGLKVDYNRVRELIQRLQVAILLMVLIAGFWLESSEPTVQPSEQVVQTNAGAQ